MPGGAGRTGGNGLTCVGTNALEGEAAKKTVELGPVARRRVELIAALGT